MSVQLPEIVSAVGIGIGAIGWVVYHLSVSRELRTARRETSRFPLFAARDELVLLVAEGRISENDPGWRNLYDGVNFFLNIKNKLHVLDCVSRYVNHLVAVRNNPQLKSRVQKALSQEEYAARRVPEFARVRDEVRVALRHLISRRTHRGHILGVYVWVLLLRITMSAGVKTARDVKKSVVNPSYDDVMVWPAVEEERAAA